MTHQHDPEIQPNGNIVVCTYGRPPQAIEIDRAGEVAWAWRLPPDMAFPGVLIRDADRLPNGNTLITLGTRVVEVTREGRIVWQLRVRGEEKPGVGAFFQAERIGMVAPQISIASPQARTHESRDIDVAIQYRQADLDTVWFRVYDCIRGKWATEESMYVRRARSFNHTQDRGIP